MGIFIKLYIAALTRVIYLIGKGSLDGISTRVVKRNEDF